MANTPLFVQNSNINEATAPPGCSLSHASEDQLAQLGFGDSKAAKGGGNGGGNR